MSKEWQVVQRFIKIKMDNLRKLYSVEGLDVDQVIIAVEPLIFQLYRKYLPTFPKDECMQLGRMAVAEALKCYKPEKKTSVFSFIYTIVRNKMITGLIYEFNLHQKFHKNHDRLDRDVISWVRINHEKNKLRDLISDDNTKMPFDNLFDEEMKQAIHEEIMGYLNNKRYKKSERTKNMLLDYFYYLVSAADMRIKYGEKYDRPVTNFKKWMLRKFDGWRYKNQDEDKRNTIKIARWLSYSGRWKYYTRKSKVRLQPWRL